MIFEFEENEYFTNTLLEKTYNISKELLLTSITSTKIDWKEGKNISSKKVTKNMKNKSKQFYIFPFIYIERILKFFRNWRSEVS